MSPHIPYGFQNVYHAKKETFLVFLETQVVLVYRIETVHSQMLIIFLTSNLLEQPTNKRGSETQIIL